MTPDQALKRIKKCLALAQSAEPHEAAAAIRQAQALMQKHGLDHAAVELSDITEVSLKSAGTVIQDWEVNLASMVSKSLGITAMTRKGHAKGYSRDLRLIRTKAVIIFVGTAAKVKVAEYMFQSLVRQMRKARAQATSRRLTRDEILMFNTGWLFAVEPKISAFAQPFDGRIDAYIATKGPVETHDGGHRVKKALGKGVRGLNSGYQAGQQAELHQAMEAGKQTAVQIGMNNQHAQGGV